MEKQTIVIPDLGGVDQVTVLEIFVAVGDMIEPDQALMSLESEKASMDVPSDRAGRVEKILLQPGDVVGEGDACMVVTAGADQVKTDAIISGSAGVHQQEAAVKNSTISGGSSLSGARDGDQALVSGISEDSGQTKGPLAEGLQLRQLGQKGAGNGDGYASPSVRKFARKMGIDIVAVPGSGRAGRVTLDDIAQTVQSRMEALQNRVSKAPVSQCKSHWVDPAKFGPCDEKSLNKIKKSTASAMSRSWERVVHVTQFEKVDITELEQYRSQHKEALKSQSIRLTMLAFIMKALASALKKHPATNASYNEDTAQLWLKQYYHIGVAVDTPSGLVVPVIRDVDQLSVIEIAVQLGAISKRARDGALQPRDLAGASFTVSSLGGIGGTYFTPIVNSPQTAILGVSRSTYEPVWNGREFQGRLMLPLSLSYDHRIIDGAEAMRFLNDYTDCLKALDQKDLSVS